MCKINARCPMVHLLALHQSRIAFLRRPRQAITQRPFFSFLGSSTNSRLVEDAAAAKLKQEEARILLDGVYHRISTQNAHPLGPWQAILTVVQDHYNSWMGGQEGIKAKVSAAMPHEEEELRIAYRVLDLACGPRGEPGTTIAHALPLATVHCTDSCSVAVAAVPVHIYVDESNANANTAATAVIGVDTRGLNEENNTSLPAMTDGVTPIQAVPLTPSNRHPKVPPPKNLTKSITNLTDLSSYTSDSFDAVICCYGYNLSSNIQHALSEAHRVLVPGGILVIATWEQSAMLAIGRDVVAYVKGGGRDPYSTLDDDESFLPPRITPVNKIELSGVGELEGLLIASGFDQPQAVVATSSVYPIDLGSTPADQFATGTILVRDELESLGALESPEVDDGWGNLAEEAFWMNIQKYAVYEESGNLLLRDNIFKLTVSTKK